MNSRYFAITASLAILSATNAEALTGSDLYQECLDKSRGIEEIGCLSYVRGFVDGIFSGVAIERLAIGFCPPKEEGLDATQARLIVEKYLREHPEQLHVQAGLLVGSALIAAFPCPKKSN
jgi:hypothetical protein